MTVTELSSDIVSRASMLIVYLVPVSKEPSLINESLTEDTIVVERNKNVITSTKSDVNKLASPLLPSSICTISPFN